MGFPKIPNGFSTNVAAPNFAKGEGRALGIGVFVPMRDQLQGARVAKTLDLVGTNDRALSLDFYLSWTSLKRAEQGKGSILGNYHPFG
jgi:hypothetical protein